MNITISTEIKKAVPNLILGIVTADVKVQENNPALWELIDKDVEQLKANLKIDDISKIPTITSSRKAYKALGKDPARYRLSAEALMRRTLKGNDLYRINNVVDLLNLISLKTGYSIGGYDIDKIDGDILMTKGEENVEYEGIGRGMLNIQNLPVLKDRQGTFGSPTSDSVRTSVTVDTERFMMVIFNFGNHPLFDETMALAEQFLLEFGGATRVEKTLLHI